MFNVIIAGSRDFNNYELLKSKCNNILSNSSDICIISGTARGADKLGERYANEQGYAIQQFPADWNKYGKSAGYKRNQEMAEHADALIAFWDGQSRGTEHMIDIAKEKGLLTRIIFY